MAKIYRTLHYRQCRWQPSGPTLFNALSQALNRRPVGRRTETISGLDTDHPTRVLINVHAAWGEGMSGTLIEWTEGQGQPFLVTVDDAAEQLDVELSPGQLKFITGMSYFFLRGNHVVLSPAISLPTSRMEEHWRWLLERQSGAGNAPAFTLREVPKEPARVEAMLQNVKSVEISPAPAIERESTSGRGGETTLTTNVTNNALVRSFMEWLAQFGPSGVEPAVLSQALASPNVRATISISYAGQLPTDGAWMLDKLAEHVSQIEEGAHVGYKIESRMGNLSTEDLRLRNRVRVSATEGHPDRRELWQYMSDWLEGLIASRTVRENV